MNKLSELTGVNKKSLTQFFLAVLIILVLLGVGASLLTTVLGVIYPVFMTFYTIEQENNAEEADKQWLTYWAVFGVFSIID